MKTNLLRPLFDAGKLWQGNTETTIEVTDTGFPELNAQLCSQGWPAHMLIEFLTDDCFSAPIQCALATWRSQQDARWIAFVNPPLTPCTERLMQEGIDTEKVDIIHVANDQLAWCLEQITLAESTRSVIAWETETLTSTQLRRLQLACQRGHTQLFLIRQPAHRHQASPAPVRAKIDPSVTGFEITIFKQPGTNARPPIVIPSELSWVRKPHPAQRVTCVKHDSSGLH